jgi:hypothetical protein
MNNTSKTIAWYVLTSILILSALVIAVVLWSTVSQALAPLRVLAGLG